MRKDYYLYMGPDKREYFSLPKRWAPLHFVETAEGAPLPSVAEMTLEALSNPVGTPPFRNLVSKANNVAVIVNDGTRPTPVAEILRTLLSGLSETGFNRENVTIVVATGTHEPMSQDALEARLGGNILHDYKVVQHNAWQSDLVPIKIPDSDKVVRVNPEVAGADMKVGISSALPHPMAGFSGGPKILMPGVSHFDYIRDHHTQTVMHHLSRMNRTKDNPFHEGVFKTAQAIGLDFSINCVYNQQGRLVRITGGSLEASFKKAIDLCFEKLSHVFEEKVDVTITSTFPHTHGHQLFKGLAAPNVVTKHTGAILLVAPIVGNMSADFLNSFELIRQKSNGDPAAYIEDHLTRGKAFLPDKSIDFNMAMYSVFLRPAIKTILVSPLISRDEARIMGMDYAPSIEEGLALLEGLYPEAKTAIFPSGGLIIPKTAWE